MSEVSQGPGWWQASDGKWYPPEAQPGPSPGMWGEPARDASPQLWQQGWQSPGAALPPFQAGAVAQYCATCGNGLVATAAVCPRCGTPVSRTQVGAKSRTAAVVLAVFLSFWSFLYTYSNSASKFWLGFGLSIGSLILAVIIDDATHSNAAAGLWALIALGVWIWSIVDRSTARL